MLAAGLNSPLSWLPVILVGLLGYTASSTAQALISRRLPRLGGPPARSARITTAALTGLCCVAFAIRFGLSLYLPAFLFLAVLGLQLARIDVAMHLLPNPLVLMLLLGGIALFLLPAIFDQQTDDLVRAALGAVIMFAGYLILGLISPGSMGMGDVKLAAPVGLYLGYLGWAQLLHGGLLGFVLNGVVTVFVMRMKAGNKPSEVPHGPSMLGATVLISLIVQ